MHVPIPVPDTAISLLRTGAWSIALAAHAALLLMLSLADPGDGELPLAVPPAAIQVDIVQRPPPLAEVPPPPMPALPSRPRPQRASLPTPLPIPAVPAEAALPRQPALPVAGSTQAAGSGGDDAGMAEAAPGGDSSLAVLHAPAPAYPPRMQRLGREGEVLLRIRIGADGRPREVVVLRGSGHAELDRAAREQVLRNWRFAAPRSHGREIDAWGEVPIRFTLARG